MVSHIGNTFFFAYHIIFRDLKVKKTIIPCICSARLLNMHNPNSEHIAHRSILQINILMYIERYKEHDKFRKG